MQIFACKMIFSTSETRNRFRVKLVFSSVVIRLIYSKVLSCKLYNNKYMIASTRRANVDLLRFIAALFLKPVQGEFFRGFSRMSGQKFPPP